jgi:hypothetical protein
MQRGSTLVTSGGRFQPDRLGVTGDSRAGRSGRFVPSAPLREPPAAHRNFVHELELFANDPWERSLRGRGGTSRTSRDARPDGDALLLGRIGVLARPHRLEWSIWVFPLIPRWDGRQDIPMLDDFSFLDPKQIIERRRSGGEISLRQNKDKVALGHETTGR